MRTYNKQTETNDFLTAHKKAKGIATAMKNSVLAQSIKFETEKALLLSLYDIEDGSDFDFWTPKSVITKKKKLENDVVEITFAKWFFDKYSNQFLKTVELNFNN